MTVLNHVNIWSECLSVLREVTSSAEYRTWFAPIQSIDFQENTLTIEVPSDYFRERLEREFLPVLRDTLRSIIGPKAKLVYKVRISNNTSVSYPSQGTKNITNPDLNFNPESKKNFDLSIVDNQAHHVNINPNLKSHYCFENLIVGNCNKLAATAGLAISEKPGNTPFNPLLLYGGPGLGKTHLSQSIGIKIKELFPDKVVLYVSAYRFQTQYMDAVTVKNKLTDFINFYQSIDVLIVDDVHEFADKKGTQNAFFQIFNHLHQSGKQLILTCDKAPAELKDLDNRLLSRFKWGLSTELSVPDFNTRVSILKDKSFKEGIELPEEVIEYIAHNVNSNIREIEGTLVSLIANATLNNSPITLDLTRDLIKKIVTVKNNELSVNKITETVSNYFQIDSELLLSNTRKREIVQARQIAMYLCRSLINLSLDNIGKEMGGKNHATVLYAYNAVSDLLKVDQSFKNSVNDLEKILRNN